MRWFLLMVAILWATLAAAVEPNLLTNGSLEGDFDGDGVADGWFAEVHRQEGGEGTFALDGQAKVLGKFSQQINHTSEKGWVRVSQDGIPAQPNARYLFRCWVKANCRFLLIVYTFKADGSYDTFVIAQGQGTGDEWRLFSGTLATPTDARSFKVSLVTDSKGVAWFDGAELVLLERPPYVFVPVTAAAPKIDGNLSDACWQSAEMLTPFLELGTGKVAEPQTVAKIVATPTHLFVAFRCDEPNPQGMRLRTPESGEPAYTDDCVEVYLDPQHTHSGFWQFVVTPKGNKWAQYVEPSQWARVWWLLPRPAPRVVTDGWQCASQIGDKFWTAEIAVPFALLGFKPQAGSVVGINLCRSRKTGHGTRGMGQGEQNSAFAYFVPQTFQRPEKFPHVVLVGTGDQGLGTGSKTASVKPDEMPVDALQMLTPKPQRIIVYGKQQLKMQPTVQIVLPSGATELERTGANQLIQTLQQVGVTATISPQLRVGTSSIVLATIDKLPSLPFDLPDRKSVV